MASHKNLTNKEHNRRDLLKIKKLIIRSEHLMAGICNQRLKSDQYITEQSLIAELPSMQKMNSINETNEAKANRTLNDSHSHS